MAVATGSTNMTLRTDAAEALQDLTRKLAVEQCKRVTLSDTLLLVIKHYKEHVEQRETS